MLFLGTSSAQAHPADLFFQAYTLRLTPTTLQLSWTLVPGPMLVRPLWSEINQNQDRQVSPDEARAWVTSILPQWSADVDGTPLRWQLDAVEWPTSLQKLQIGEEKIVVHLTAVWPPQLANAAQLTLHNHFQELLTIHWFSLQGDSGVKFHTPQQLQGALVVEVSRPGQSPANDLSTDQSLFVDWDSGTPSLEAAVVKTVGLAAITQQVATGPLPQDLRPAALLTTLIRSGRLSFGFSLLAFAIAGILGALHALTPGHGKTLVAAYLVGTRGTTRHAISLGAIVTLTHTGSVFALGLVTLVASHYLLATSLFPLLEIASGLLIVGLGLYLLYGRWQAWRAGDGDHHHHDHTHHEHAHHGHAHAHPHDSHHDHSHGPDAAGISWRSLATLGISGGLVPCPDAVAILLVAIAVNRIRLGLSLLVAFSLGLALVLIVIGLLLVHSRRLVERIADFQRVAPMLPVVSAMIVLLLGVGLTYSAIRGAAGKALPLAATPTLPGQQSVAGSAVGGSTLDQARLLYLVPDDQNRLQLAVRHLTKDDPLLLTQAPLGLSGYALSPDKSTIVYTVQREEEGADLWRMRADGSQQQQLLACPRAICDNAVWSPDGERLVYERLDLAAADNPLGLLTLWWLDGATGQTRPVFPHSQWPGFNPSWSPDGQWLSYASPGSSQIVIYNLIDGRRHALPNQTGEPVAWQPDASTLLLQEIREQAGRSFMHLLRFDLTSAQVVDLSEKTNTEDIRPAWSPDGQWIAMVRQELSNPDTAKNRQLWVMHADGSEARRLTNQMDVFYDGLRWSPDGQYLYFHQYFLKQLDPPAIWLLHVQTGELQPITSPRSWPTWLP